MSNDFNNLLEKLDELYAASTQEEWWYDGLNYVFAKIPAIGDAMVAETRGVGAGLPVLDNGYFIAALHNAYPRLRIEIIRLRIEASKDSVDKVDNVWAEDPDHPVSDWRLEVANDDTRRGYWDWVWDRQREASEDCENGTPGCPGDMAFNSEDTCDDCFGPEEDR